MPNSSLTIFEGQLTYETEVIDVVPGRMPGRVGQYSPEMARKLARYNTPDKKVVTFSGLQYRLDQVTIDFGWKGHSTIVWDEDGQTGFECKALQYAKICLPYTPEDDELDASPDEPEIHILEETEEILDYTCRKATYHLGAEAWEVWFTEEVEMAAPCREMIYKKGIPGLILKIRDVADPNSIFIKETKVTHLSTQSPGPTAFQPPADHQKVGDFSAALQANRGGLIDTLKALENEPLTDFTGYWKLDSETDDVYLEVGFDEEQQLWHQLSNFAMGSSQADKAEIHGVYLVVPQEMTHGMYRLEGEEFLANMTYAPLSYRKITQEAFQAALSRYQNLN